MNKKLFIVLIFIVATGFCTGTFLEVNMDVSEKNRLSVMLSNYLFNADKSSFFETLKLNLIPIAFFYISPASVVLLPVDSLFLFLKGIVTGFAATALLESFGLLGIGYFSLTLLPVSALQIAVFVVLGVLAFSTKKTSQQFARSYNLAYSAGLVVLIFSGILQAFLLGLIGGPS